MDVATGKVEFLAGEADIKGRLVLAGIGDNDTMMRLKASENDAGYADLQSNRDGVGNLPILGRSHDARSKNPGE
jgi:hypothetical protein